MSNTNTNTNAMTSNEILCAAAQRTCAGALLWAGEADLILTPIRGVPGGYAITRSCGAKEGVTSAELVTIAPDVEAWCASILPLDDALNWDKAVPAWRLFQALPEYGQRMAWRWASDAFPHRYPTAGEFIERALTGAFNWDAPDEEGL